MDCITLPSPVFLTHAQNPALQAQVLFGPAGDLALKGLPGHQANPRTLGLGLFCLGWVGESDDAVAVVAVEPGAGPAAVVTLP